MTPFAKFQIQASDGAVYEVDAPEPAIVFTLMVSSLIEGKLLDMEAKQAKSISFAGRPLSADEAWSIVKQNSWPLLLQVLNSLTSVQTPQGVAIGLDSFTRLMLLKEEAVRRCRSLRFASLAIASRN